MIRCFLVAAALVGAMAVPFQSNLWGQEAAIIESKFGDQKVTLELTGSAVRSKDMFEVYTIASYVEQGFKVQTAQDMVALDRPKQLHLRMLRRVPGKSIAENFQTIFRANHPEPEFDEEVKTVLDILSVKTVKKGDEIWFTHLPGTGFQYQIAGGAKHLVRNVEFSKAVWENYFGKHNVGEKVKHDLLSRRPG